MESQCQDFRSETKGWRVKDKSKKTLLKPLQLPPRNYYLLLEHPQHGTFSCG